MVWSSSTTRHAGWLRSVLTLWPDGLNASNPFLPDPLASPSDGSSPRFRIICSFSDAMRSIEPYQRAWRSIGKMEGDEPTSIVPTISKPCLRLREVFSEFYDQRYAGRCS